MKQNLTYEYLKNINVISWVLVNLINKIKKNKNWCFKNFNKKMKKLIFMTKFWTKNDL